MSLPLQAMLLDVMLPGMDSWAVPASLKSHPDLADIPVLVLSARDVTAEERIRLSEADRVLRKGDASLQDIATELRRIDNRSSGRDPSEMLAPLSDT